MWATPLWTTFFSRFLPFFTPMLLLPHPPDRPLAPCPPAQSPPPPSRSHPRGVPPRPSTGSPPPWPRSGRPAAARCHRCRSAQHGPVSPAGDQLRRCVPYRVSPLSVLTTLAVACAGDSCRALERPHDAGPLYISSRSV